MPVIAREPAAAQGGVFRGTDALVSGDLTRQQLRGVRWRRLLRGVYADAQLPVTHGLYIAAAQLLIPAEAVIAGRSAGWLYGVGELAAASDPVDVLVADVHRFGPVSGLRIHTTQRLLRADVDDRNGLRSTAPLRTAMDIARTAGDLTDAVTALDRLLARAWSASPGWNRRQRGRCRAAGARRRGERYSWPMPAASHRRSPGCGSASCCGAASTSSRNTS